MIIRCSVTKLIKMSEEATDSLVSCCSVIGCTNTLNLNSNTVFYVLIPDNMSPFNVRKYKMKQEDWKICNDHFLSAEILNLNQDFLPDSSGLNILRSEISNFETTLNSVSTSSSPSQSETNVHISDIDLEEILPGTIEEICRVCLSDGPLKNINTENENKITVKEMLQKFNCFNPAKFSQKICETCINDLTIAYNFLVRFENSTQHFLQYPTKTFTKLIEKENSLNKKCTNDVYQSKYNDDLVKNIEKDRKSVVLLEKFSMKDIQKLKNELKQKGNKRQKMVNKKLKSKNKKTNLKKHDNKSKTLECELPEELKRRIIEKTQSFTQQEKLQKLVELIKQNNPFLTEIQINEKFKEKSDNLPYISRRRKLNVDEIKMDRILIVTTQQIQEIFENNLKNNVITIDNAKFSNCHSEKTKPLFYAQVYPCTSCNKCFLTESFLDRHYCEEEEIEKLVLADTDWKCQICKEVFGNLQCLINHRCHEPFKCMKCAIEYNTIDELKNHVEIQHESFDPSRVQCNLCGADLKPGKRQKNLRKHKLNLHYNIYVASNRKEIDCKAKKKC